MKRFILLFIFLSINIAATAQKETDSLLQVGYAGSSPFIIQTQDAENPDGIVMEIWKEIVFPNDIQYKLHGFDSVDEGIKAVKNGEIDALIGPITINSKRAADVAFSTPFYSTETAILSPVKDLSLWGRVKPFFSIGFIIAVISFLFVLFIVGTLFYLAEGRKYPEEYGDTFLKGTGIGVWLAITTMTTVGYGDFAPKTPIGRVILGSWMVISLIMATSFIAGIAGTLASSTQHETTITSIAQLGKKKIAAPDNDDLLNQIRSVGGSVVVVKNVNEGLSLLKNDKVDALVYDYIPLKYNLKDIDADNYTLTKDNILTQNYGFAFSEDNNKLRKTINIEILKLSESRKIKDIVQNYVNTSSSENAVEAQ